MAKHNVSRREFVRLSTITAVGAVVAACGATPTATPVPTATKAPVPPTATKAPAAPTAAPAAPTATKAPAAPTTAPAAPTATKAPVAAVKYNEAPMLAELVKSGKLPTVDKRLPNDPLVIKATEVGKYGGDLKTCGDRISPLNGYNWANYNVAFVAYDWSPTGYTGKITPNIAKSYDVNAAGTKWTFHLREGVKWSDGTPLTSADAAFWYEKVVNNKELTPASALWLTKSDGKTLKDFKAVDTYTIEFSSDAPDPWFMDRMASMWAGGAINRYPKHYMSKFHPDFVNPTELKATAEKAGLQTWMQLFSARVGNINEEAEAAKPRLQAWVAKRVQPETPPWVWERNPYFWAVDQQGNQLPYLDRVTHTQVSIQVRDLKAITGEMDYVSWMDVAMLPEVIKAQDQKKVKPLKLMMPGGIDHSIFFNMDCKDEVLRKIFNDKRFRMACSYAFNREEMNKLLYLGLLKPSQPGPPLGSETRAACEKAGLLNMYLEYDPKKANQLLDEMGLDKKNSAGWRLRPDGKELFIEFITYNWANDAEMEIAWLQAVGINCTFKMLASATYSERVNGAADFDAICIQGETIHPYIQGGRYYAPTYREGPFVQAGRWFYYGGKEGTAPTGLVKDALDDYNALMKEMDPKKQIDLVVKLVKRHNEELWRIGTLTMAPQIASVNYNLKNIPEEVVMGWDNHMADVFRTETMFYGT